MNRTYLKAIALSFSILSPSIFANDNIDLRLYHLDCGRFSISPMNVFSDTDAYPNRNLEILGSCYLIKHNDDWLLWDTGLPGAISEKPSGVINGPFHFWVDKTLPEQLKTLGLTKDDITHVGVSHAHFDHIGNVNLFEQAELIIQKLEYDFLADPKQARTYHMEPDYMSYFLAGKGTKQVNLLNGDTDIFGDGTIKAVSLPGHTPGHMALQVELPETGTVFLSGDQWHFKENHVNDGVPKFNYNRMDTLAASKKLNALLSSTNGKLIIQHDIKDNEALPDLPNFLK